MPAIRYREKKKKRTQFANRIREITGDTTTLESAGDMGWATLGLADLAVKKKARTAVRDHLRTLRSSKAVKSKTSSRKKKGSKARLSDLLIDADQVSASHPVVLRRVVAQNGTIYPLRQEITVVVKEAARSADAFIHELQWLHPLFGTGQSSKLAVQAFQECFHQLVMQHRRKPPHTLSDEDKTINVIFDHLIDWNRFDQENPIEQPLWGRKGELNDDGDLLVQWVLGPRDERDAESTILAHDVCDELKELPEGAWFYGAGRVFSDRIEWTTLPVETPDPHDEEAIAQAWDLIPEHVMSDANAWPLKKGQ